MRFFLILPAVIAMLGTASAGPLAYGICQAGCSTLVVSCYAAGGLTFGTITAGAGAPAVALACCVRSSYFGANPLNCLCHSISVREGDAMGMGYMSMLDAKLLLLFRDFLLNYFVPQRYFFLAP
ncbi:hypothetical protein L211DRAFT_845208 [Terfezia boudieri ATCC MYA-4762]|uniref:Uncharacterized protein n=1 Tax=Terfezia boudieri ATCC MYA-4762 TaxID=1051890 RepID=A0A3N4M9D4_9PEZI|nr:hypothetical protein L211DRAFT_845208 [Terfezia boudieri ATCC MYA-4762]